MYIDEEEALEEVWKSLELLDDILQSNLNQNGKATISWEAFGHPSKLLEELEDSKCAMANIRQCLGLESEVEKEQRENNALKLNAVECYHCGVLLRVGHLDWETLNCTYCKKDVKKEKAVILTPKTSHE